MLRVYVCVCALFLCCNFSLFGMKKNGQLKPKRTEHVYDLIRSVFVFFIFIILSTCQITNIKFTEIYIKVRIPRLNLFVCCYMLTSIDTTMCSLIYKYLVNFFHEFLCHIMLTIVHQYFIYFNIIIAFFCLHLYLLFRIVFRFNDDFVENC